MSTAAGVARVVTRTPDLRDGAVYVFYLALSGWVTAGLWQGLGDRMTDGNRGGNEDYRLFEWYLAYVARSIHRLDNPFFSDLQNAPDGVSLMSNTGLVGLGVPLAPVTWLAGPTVTANLVVCLSLFATAATWYFVLSRHLVTSRFAAAIGGFLCGFGPGMIAHTRGHLNFIAQFLIPLVIVMALRLREPGTLTRRAVPLGLLAAWQVLIGEEILFLFFLAAGVFVLAYAARDPREARQMAPRFLSGIGVAAGVGFLFLAYPLWQQFFGPQAYHTVPFVSGHGADLLSYPATPQLSIFGNRPDNEELALNPAEENTFFTIPYLLLVAGIVIWLWRSRLVQALVATAAVLIVLSLGPTLKFDGHDTAVPLPWRALAKLPLMDSILPARFGLVAGVIFAVLVAYGLDAALARFRVMDATRLQVVATALVVAVVVPLVPKQVPTIPVGHPVPTFITSGEWRSHVRDGRSLVPVPFPDVRDASGLRWAAVTGVPFAVPGGYFIGPDEDGRGRFGPVPRPTAELLIQVAKTGRVPLITDGDRAGARADMAHWQADLVVLGRHRHRDALRETLDALLAPGRTVSDVTVWNVRDLA